MHSQSAGKSEAKLNGKGYSTAEEKRILDALGRGLLKEFPNPNRVGCPGSEVLKQIASRGMPLSEAEPWLNHLGSCSPCYRDFSQLRSAHRQRRTRMNLAAAASVLIVVGLTTWAILHQHNQQIVRAVIDLRERSMARGTEPAPSEQPLDILRDASLLDIYLPLGSDEASYDVRITSVDGEQLLSRSGEAKLSDGLAVLRIHLGRRLLSRGTYVLQIRKQGSEWVSFPLRIR